MGSQPNGSKTRWREAIYLSYPRATPSTLEAALQRRRNTKTTHPPRPFLFWGVYVYVHNTRGEESGGNGTIPNAPALSLAEGFPKRNPTPSLYQHPLTAIHHSSLRSRSGEIMRGVKFPPLPPRQQSPLSSCSGHRGAVGGGAVSSGGRCWSQSQRRLLRCPNSSYRTVPLPLVRSRASSRPTNSAPAPQPHSHLTVWRESRHAQAA